MGSKNAFYYDIEAGHPGVTGSSIPVRIRYPNGEHTKFLVDCGLFQEKEYEGLNNSFIFNPEEISFVLVTHNHVDHTGRLPLLIKRGFSKKIYASHDTCVLMPLALEDSQKVLRDLARRKGKPVLYNEVDVLKTKILLESCIYGQTVQVDDHIKVTFFKNGHLIGAAIILVQISYPDDEETGCHYDDINILFTGDYNSKNIFFTVGELPKWVKELQLTVVQEATYGYMESSEMKESFKTNVLEAINDKKTVVVPVFSLGRSQEILYELKCMQDEGKLDYMVPIYYDGKLGIKYTNLYLKEGLLDIKPTMRSFLPENLIFVDKSIRGGLLDDRETKIILTTSGMGSYGPAQTYLPRYISREDALIHFTGFVSEGTLGYRLKYAAYKEKVEVGGLVAKKLARVEYTSEYSAHAKADEMIQFLAQFTNLKLVLVNHGQTSVKKQFAARIVDEISPKDVGILGDEYLFRVNAYGLVEQLSTEFN